MQYIPDSELDKKVEGLVTSLELTHIRLGQVKCIRSLGSKSRRTLARIHTISRALQTGLSIQPHYVIEVISENFNPLSEEEQTKTLIHELLHIPHAFGGGFRHHNPHVNRRVVEKAYKKLRKRRQFKFPW